MTWTQSSPRALSGSHILAAVKAAGIEYVLSVPDITTSDGLLWPLAKGQGPELIRVCKEDEAIGIAARVPGASIGTVEVRPVKEITGLPAD